MSATATSMDIRAPSGQEEGTRSQVLRWLKGVGEPVAEHEPLIELETDKVTVEVASPGAGVLTEILKQEQEEVAPGELLGRIGLAAAEHTRGAAEPAHASGAGAATSRERGAVARSGIAPAAGPEPPATAPRGGAARQLSPAVRRLLAEHSLDPTSVRGTGEGGRITVADVMQAVPVDTAEESADSSGMEGAASH